MGLNWDTSSPLGRDADGEILDVDDETAILHRHEWRRQKWEYKIEVYMWKTGDAQEREMKALGLGGWELSHQRSVDYGPDSHRGFDVCTFKRPKVEDES
jgi:hypothetical protein